MKIVSENPKILNELSSKFEAQKVQESKDDGGMGALETIALLLDIAVSLIEIYEFLERNFPDWKLIFVPIIVPKSDEVEMTPEKYDALSPNAKKAVLEHYKIVIKKK
jgi:hypothetical protein